MSETRPKRQAVEIAVLAVLADGPSYGYAITKEVAARSDGQLSAAPGVLYPLLRTMEKEGLVSTSWETVRSDRASGDEEEGESEGRRRKWYTLSAKGTKRLNQSISAHRAWTAMMDRVIEGASEGNAP